ncbi:MAG: hypothetical protein JWQ76_3526 [Ramlibacter sp.]|nr:hypothetical protein [Ramlibacter sp.]
MNAAELDFWAEQADEPVTRVDGRIEPQAHDAYWQAVYWGEAYYRSECEYEDYAPAYCVGYIGYAQYGGCFDDAEKSLAANWFRIKGDSRLTVDEAMQAIRAAWDHAAQVATGEEEERLEEITTTAPQRAPAERQYATA